MATIILSRKHQNIVRVQLADGHEHITAVTFPLHEVFHGRPAVLLPSWIHSSNLRYFIYMGPCLV